MRVSARWSVGMARRYCSVVCRRRIPLRHSSGPHRTTLAAGGSTPYPHSVRVGQGEGETLLGDGASVAHGAGPRRVRGIRTAGKDAVSYTHLRAHETRHDLVCRLLLEKKKNCRLETQTKQQETTQNTRSTSQNKNT